MGRGGREKLVVTGFNRAGNSTNFIRAESSFLPPESFREGFINFNQKEKKKRKMFIRNSKSNAKFSKTF